MVQWLTLYACSANALGFVPRHGIQVLKQQIIYSPPTRKGLVLRGASVTEYSVFDKRRDLCLERIANKSFETVNFHYIL